MQPTRKLTRKKEWAARPHEYDPKGRHYSNDELMVILHRYRGEIQKGLPKGKPKSTEIHIWDISIIANICRTTLHHLMKKDKPSYFSFGDKRRERLSYYLDLIEGGYVTKDGYRNYVIHPYPVVKKMKINFDAIPSLEVVHSPVHVNIPKPLSVFDALKG